MVSTFTKSVCGIEISCTAVKSGEDYTLVVQDDKCGHIGCTVMSIGRPSHTGVGSSATTSVINRMNHKDDMVAVKFAEALAARTRACVVCNCGIHIDDITPKQIKEILTACDELIAELLEKAE